MTKNLKIILLVLIILLSCIFILYYSLQSKSLPSPVLTAEEIKREQLKASENNPIIELSETDIKLKQEQLENSEKNPIVKLTPEQIKLKQLQLAQ